MVKFVVIFLCVGLISGKAFAIDVFACEGRSNVMAPGKTMHMKLQLDEKTKEFSITVNGIKSDEAVKLMTPQLPQLEEYLKCDAYDEPCKAKYDVKDDGYMEAAAVLSIAKTLAKELPKKKQGSLAQLDPKNITKARIYQMGKTSKFGGMGVYEYFDKSEEMLGRYIYAIEAMDCKNKVVPTDDQGKALKKLMDGSTSPSRRSRTSN